MASQPMNGNRGFEVAATWYHATGRRELIDRAVAAAAALHENFRLNDPPFSGGERDAVNCLALYGVTRDRLYGVVTHDARSYIVVDTGGLDFEDPALGSQIRVQAEIAIEESDLILFVVDAIDGLVADDREIADILRRSGRPVLVVVNKCDNPEREIAAQAAHELGFPILAVSAAHGRNGYRSRRGHAPGLLQFADQLDQLHDRHLAERFFDFLA